MVSSRWVVLVLFLISVPVLVRSQPTVHVDKDTLIILPPYLLKYQSFDSSLMIDDVRKLNREDWVRNTELSLPLGSDYNITWIKFRVKNSSGIPLKGHLQSFWSEELKLYVFEDDSLISVERCGLRHGHESDGEALISFTLPAIENMLEIYGSIDHSNKFNNKRLVLDFGTQTQIDKSISKYRITNIILVSVCIAFLLYNLVTFIFTGDRIFLIYCSYSLVTVVFQLYGNFEFHPNFWPESLPITSMVWPISLVYIGLIFFTIELFSLREHEPLFCKVSYVLVALIILANLSPSNILVKSFVDILGVLIPIQGLSAAAISFGRFKVVGIYYYIGWTPLAIISVYFVFLNSGLVYSSFMLLNAITVGFAWEIFVFSLTLAYRFGQERKEKIEQQEKNLRLVQKHNSELEQTVVDRTEEIRAQNEELMMLNEELNMQQEELTATNEELIGHVNRQEQLSEEKDKIILVINQYVAGPFKRVKETLKSLGQESDRVRKNRMIKEITSDIEATENLILDIYDENSLERDSFQLTIEEVNVSERIYEVMNETPLLNGTKDFSFDDMTVNTDSDLFGRMVKNLIELIVILGDESINISTQEEVTMVQLIFDVPKIELHPKVKNLDDLIRFTPDKIKEQRPLQLRISLVVAICKRLNYDSRITHEESGIRIVVDVSKEEHFETISSNKRYLEDDEAKEIYGQVVGCFTDQKIFTDANLSINQLSERLSIHSKKISYAVNLISGNNFQNFVNEYRVEEAKKRLLDPGNAHLSYMAIGYDAGFNSKSAFYSAFKKATGLSPKDFIDNSNSAEQTT